MTLENACNFSICGIEGSKGSSALHKRAQTRLRRLSKSYVKRLPYTWAISFLINSFFGFLALYFPLVLVVPPLLGSVLVIFWPFLTPTPTRRFLLLSAGNATCSEKIMRFQQWLRGFFVYSVCFAFGVLLPLDLWLELFTDLNSALLREQVMFPFNHIAFFLYWWPRFFLFMIPITYMFCSLGSHRKARLSFQVTIDALGRVLKRKRVLPKDANRCRKWLELGLQNCNDFLIRKPYLVKVKNIRQYSNHVFLSLLLRDKGELEKIYVATQKVLQSLGKKRSQFFLSDFLIALRLILGKNIGKQEPNHVLSDMIVTKPSLRDRIRATLRAPSSEVIVGIVALAVSIITFFFTFFF